MTQEALHALDMLKLERQYHKEFNDIVEKYPLLNKEDPKDPCNSSILALREPYSKKYVEQGMKLHDHCMAHRTIKTEFEQEIKKLDVKIQKENKKFEAEAKDDYDFVSEWRAKAAKKAAGREKSTRILKILTSCLVPLWIAVYLVLVFSLSPSESIIPNLLIEAMWLFLFLPVIGLIFLTIIIRSGLDDFRTSAAEDVKRAEESYQKLEAEKAESVAHLTAQKTDYQYLINLINRM